MNMEPERRTSETPLESWKEIGAYLNRNEVTARRWEKEEGLPIHRQRHKGRSSVYAYPSEIDHWRAGRRVIAEPPQAPARAWSRPVAMGVTALLCLMMAGNSIHPQSVSAQSLVARQIPLDPAISLITSSFSADGRWFVSSEWPAYKKNELVVRELATGQRRVLQTGLVCMESTCGETDVPLLSPDLKQVAYNWFGYRDRVSQLRLIANESGAEPRTLARGYYFEPAAWAPDGKSILVIVDLPDHTTQQISWIRISDGAVTVLKSFPLGVSRPRLSPDGKYIAYAARSGGAASQVFVLSSEGKNETVLTKGAATSEAPSWTPDGNHILYTSNQVGQFDLFSVEIRDGKPAGVASVIKRNLGQISAIGTTPSGTFLYKTSRVDPYDALGEMTFSNGQLTLNLTEKFAGGMPAWSPDGKSIAFKRLRPGEQRYDLVVRSVASGDERIYSHERIMFPASPNWLRDGKNLIVPVASEKGQTSFHRVDAASGRFTEVVPPDPLHGPFARLSPDDRVLFINTRRGVDDPVVDHVSSYNLRTKQRGIDLPLKAEGLSFWFSPDGRRMGFGSRGQDGKFHLGVANADGTGYHEIYSMPEEEFPRAIVCWGPDGRSLLFGKGGSEKQTLIMRVPVEGGQAQSTGLYISSEIEVIVPAGDGSHVALFGREHTNELWALENVLSAVK